MKRLLFAVCLSFAAAPAFACSHGGFGGMPVGRGFNFDDDTSTFEGPTEPTPTPTESTPTESTPTESTPTESTPAPTITVTFTDADGTTQTTAVPEDGASATGEGSVVTEVVVAPPAPPPPPPPPDVRLDDFIG